MLGSPGSHWRLDPLQQAHAERLRRDHSEGVAANKALRQQLEAARTASEALRARLEERTRARDTAASQAQGLLETSQGLQARLQAAEATAAEVDTLRQQVRRGGGTRPRRVSPLR